MSNESVENRIDEFETAHSSVRVDGLPHWKTRELADEYTEERKKLTGVDLPFLLLTLVILMIGVIMVLSASFVRASYLSGEPMRFFSRQLIFAISGVALMILTSRVKVSTMSRFSMYSLLFSVALLVIVLFIGIELNGAKRWIGVGELTFQPSEIAKLAVILSFAQMICKFGGARMRTFKYGVAPFLAITAIIVILLEREPHLSAAIIITALMVIMMFAGGTRLRWFLLAGLAVAAIAGAVILVNARGQIKDIKTIDFAEQITQIEVGGNRLDYAGGRIGAWLDPDADPLAGGYQIRQSLNAVGSGGLLGQGLGKSRQKYLYLPEEHNDYIFAVVCEELGYIGAMLILMLFTLLIIRGYWLALHAKDRFSALITTGITSLLAIQVFLNVAVVTNLVPATGISLPFFSSGGTALWIQLFQMGIILAVSREIPAYAGDRG